MSRTQQGMPAGFGRSAGGAMGRGLALIVVAVVIGVLLLRATDGSEPFQHAGGTEDDGGTGGTGTTTPEGGGQTTGTTAPPAAQPRDPSQVTVLVANGSGVRGAAQRVSDSLKAANYVTATPINAPGTVDKSTVYFVAGYEAEARALAQRLQPTPAVAAMPNPAPVDLAGAHVLLVLAADVAANA
jgi:hypothetical protein